MASSIHPTRSAADLAPQIGSSRGGENDVDSKLQENLKEMRYILRRLVLDQGKKELRWCPLLKNCQPRKRQLINISSYSTKRVSIEKLMGMEIRPMLLVSSFGFPAPFHFSLLSLTLEGKHLTG